MASKRSDAGIASLFLILSVYVRTNRGGTLYKGILYGSQTVLKITNCLTVGSRRAIHVLRSLIRSTWGSGGQEENTYNCTAAKKRKEAVTLTEVKDVFSSRLSAVGGYLESV